METLIILDWDDTIFPTSWIKRNGINMKLPFDNEVIKQFIELDAVICNLLKKLQTKGLVIIVSNAYDSWVKLSASHLMETYEFISKYVPIISARSLYEFKYDYTKWKSYVFHDVVNKYLNNNIWDIISIGDAEHEYNALINLCNNKKIRYLKHIKFLMEPSIKELIDQLVILKMNIDYIHLFNNHIDLKFTPNLIS